MDVQGLKVFMRLVGGSGLDGKILDLFCVSSSISSSLSSSSSSVVKRHNENVCL